MSQMDDFDFGESLFVLNFASRMLTSVGDRETLVHTALETMADFGHSPRAALWLLAGDGDLLKVDAVYSPGLLEKPELEVPATTGAFDEVFKAKADRVFLLAENDQVPLPVVEGPDDAAKCLVLPVVANSGLILGAVSLELPLGGDLSLGDLSALRLLCTVLSVSLDNARLFSLAMVDALTGLFMRRFYDVRIQEELDKLEQEDSKLCLVMFDIDHFKRVNDNWGHATGDAVLREFAALVKNGLRPGKDLACRYGGEEFAVIMPGTTAEEAFVIIEEVRKSAERKAFPGIEPELKITVSAGIAPAASGQGKTPLDLFEASDKALYQAKETGRNQVILSEG